MGIIKNFFKNLVANNSIPHPQQEFFAQGLSGTRYNYKAAVGKGFGSNVLMSPIQWVMRTFPEAPIILQRQQTDGIEAVTSHSFLDFLETPNAYQEIESLLMSTVLSYSLDGNAYWYKLRNATGQVIGLTYMPHWMVEPKGDMYNTHTFLDHYEYNPNGVALRIDPKDIVHFKFACDPTCIRKGLSPVHAVMREVFCDDMAANFSGAILRNMGIPGAIISPKGEEQFSKPTQKTIRDKYEEKFTGDKAGNVMVMNTAMEIKTFSFDPKQMALPDIRDISEERICSALGIPPAVLGFGTGLQTAKVGATMKVLKALAWEGNIVPMQTVFAKTIQRQLLPEFDNDRSLRVKFDNSEISALQEDKDAKVKRLGWGYKEGWVTKQDVRLAEGLPTDDSEDEYLVNPLFISEGR